MTFCTLVLISAVWVNPCRIIYMKPTKDDDMACYINMDEIEFEFPLSCNEVANLLNQRITVK